ncbi:MAG: multifunctional CCA tRNA nucleotidyl transferase/2'3'-cyclic phosphodiesterase/2'nucleotidase/phosphatase [Oceanicoccus sp.]
MKIYLVGGAVRDKLLGYPYSERDWVVVGATAEQLISLGYQPVGKDFPVFLHPKTKEEYALARTERKSGPGYTGFDCYASPEVTLEEDLQRRDLTINAIAEDDNGTIIDPYDGQQDLAKKILRHVSPAFEEDPLRILRVARFSARYRHMGFTLADETLLLMKKISAGEELLSLPAERVWKEMYRSLSERSPDVFFTTLQQCGALKKLMPELDETVDTIVEPLQKAATKGLPDVVRFATMFVAIEAVQAENFCQRIRAPREFRELALLVSRFSARCKDNFSSPDQVLTLLENLDPFRRPERFSLFLQSSQLLYNNDRVIDQIQRSLQACKSIDTASLAAEGLRGKEIGEALRTRRLEAIAERFNQ